MQRIVTAVYPDRQQAEAAKSALADARVDAHNIHVIDKPGEIEAGRFDESRGRYGFLRDSSLPGDELHTYHDALDRGDVLVQARVEDADVDEAVRILEGSSAFDLSDREQSYTDETRRGTRTAYRRDYADDARLDAAGSGGELSEDGHIDLVEERLRVGKRDVDRGAVKVRSYVVEKPVEEDVMLHEEEVRLNRHPANRVLSREEAEEAFGRAGRTVEVHARGEEAVIDKEAVLKETIDVEKTATDKKKHVIDKIRSTEVDVDDDGQIVRGDGTRDADDARR